MIERSDTLNNQAILLASGGHYLESIACFQRAITIDRENYLLWYNLGVTYIDAGQDEKAKQALTTAFEINPENEDTVETLGTQCLSMGLLNEAVYYSNYGLELNSANAHLWNLLGVCFFQQDMYIEASEGFEMALSMNPYYKDALINLRDTYDELGNKNGVDECNLRLKEIKN